MCQCNEMSINAYLVLTTTDATLSLVATSIPAAVPFIVVGIIVVITLAVASVAVNMNAIILCMFLVS